MIDCRCTVVHTVKDGSGLSDPPYNKLSYELVVFDNNLIMKIIHKSVHGIASNLHNIIHETAISVND